MGWGWVRSDILCVYVYVCVCVNLHACIQMHKIMHVDVHEFKFGYKNKLLEMNRVLSWIISTILDTYFGFSRGSGSFLAIPA